MQECPGHERVVVHMAPGHLDAVHHILRSGSYPKVMRVLEGGATRNATTRRALEALGEVECNVVFQDAVRPLLSQRLLPTASTNSGRKAVDTAIPSADTIIRVREVTDASGLELIDDVPPRRLLRRGQTPQCCRLSVIRRTTAPAGPGLRGDRRLHSGAALLP